jgi:hypothetical protein
LGKANSLYLEIVGDRKKAAEIKNSKEAAK